MAGSTVSGNEVHGTPGIGLSGAYTYTSAIGGGGVYVMTIPRGSVPASSIARLPGLDPGLESFVDSLALLYSRKAPRDAGAVYRAYLHGVRFRMRQLLYGARGGSEQLLGPRLAASLVDAAIADEDSQLAPRSLTAGLKLVKSS